MTLELDSLLRTKPLSLEEDRSMERNKRRRDGEGMALEVSGTDVTRESGILCLWLMKSLLLK